jgi:hypothetical protein
MDSRGLLARTYFLNFFSFVSFVSTCPRFMGVVVMFLPANP